MEYSYRILDLKNGEKDSGTGYLKNSKISIKKDILDLVSKLETENYNKHIQVHVSTEDYHISLISIQKL